MPGHPFQKRRALALQDHQALPNFTAQDQSKKTGPRGSTTMQADLAALCILDDGASPPFQAAKMLFR